MKKVIFILALLFISVTNSYSQFGLSKGRLDIAFNANWKGLFTNFSAASSNCNTIHTGAYTGVIVANVGNVPNIPFYCLDLCTGISLGDSIVDSASSIPEAIYIANNFYPATLNVLPDVNEEACAVQMAVWHFRNALVIANVTMDGTTNDAAIRARAQTIINQTIANSGSSVHVTTIEIKPAGNPDNFYIRTLDTAGNPIAVNNIQLSISGGGSLSTITVNTDGTGNSPDVIVTGAANNSLIKATAMVQIPAGITYSGLLAIKQLLVLGKTTTGLRTATLLWGALPVELSSFISAVNGNDVTLNWSTVSESNNSGFDIERSVSGSTDWTKVGYSVGFGSSNTSHNYSFTNRNLSSGKYNYRLKQIDYNGNFEYHNLINEITIGVPVEFNLSQNYPNPFNPSTKIDFDIPNEGFVTLKIFNTSGIEVASLVNEIVTSGYHSINFNAVNLASGIYYYRLQTKDFTKVMKMALVK